MPHQSGSTLTRVCPPRVEISCAEYATAMDLMVAPFRSAKNCFDFGFEQHGQNCQCLLEMEQKLDWTITRKRMIFVSHTGSRQSGQAGTEGDNLTNPETGESIPAWQVRIEGRLLELPQRGKDKGPQQRFSTFIKRMMVEFDRDTNVYPENNIVEARTIYSSRNCGCNVALQDTTILLWMILPSDIAYESHLGAVQALWSYIKIQGLQDQADGRLVRSHEKLRAIFGAETIPFQKLPEYAKRHLAPPEPILLHYSFDPFLPLPGPERPTAWDVEPKMEDAALKSRMGVMLHANKETSATLAKMDEESLHNSHLERTFLQSFANERSLLDCNAPPIFFVLNLLKLCRSALRSRVS
ncbi:hypothetical protein GGU11DRAFT_845678 [Lentinula aff. detonsa]|nr:hypothetical protein GGU11DRAFT_845678 [Lentinula aff. detonsa]